MLTNNEVIESFFQCEYKSFLKSTGNNGDKSDLEKFNISEQLSLKNKFEEKNKENLYHNQNQELTLDILSKGFNYITDIKFISGDTELYCPILEKVPEKSKLGEYSYIPSLIIKNEAHIPTKDKLLIAGLGSTLSEIQGNQVAYGKVIFGKNLSSTKVMIQNNISKFNSLIEKINLNTKPDLILNRHCSSCEFNKYCREQAIKLDSLSLLSGITKERIKELNNKGIFTVYQLSYTFRPKRKEQKSRSFELQALSLREKKIHTVGKIELPPQNKTRIFLDIEGLPEINFDYLIGLIVITENEEENFSLWINSPDEEEKLITDFLNIYKSYNNPIIYHYGSYEIKYLQYIKKKFPKHQEDIEKVILSCFNVLSLAYNKIYFPTYSNSLKDIGKFIGFSWSDEKASGLQSIFWRKKWEETKDDFYKETLIIYNKEDCQALLKLTTIIDSIIKGDPLDNISLAKSENIKSKRQIDFLVNANVIPEMKQINKCAYFDYQREKVYARSNKLLRRAIKKKNKQKISFYELQPDKVINLTQETCPFCKSMNIKFKIGLSRTVADLKFSPTGVKRNIIRYLSGKYYCADCKIVFIPPEYEKIKLKIGHNLIVWTIYQHIVNKQSFRKIEETILELFNLYISGATFFTCKKYFMDYYRETYTEIEENILKSKVIYVDETPFSMITENGYAWIFTNNEEVISFYKPNREGTFLKDYLKDYTGVLVSDFFQAYDSINCPQQKCLIHLIRDFNSDLIKNPFNEEFKYIAKSFTYLLKSIVETIDKNGLKQVCIKKYKPNVLNFFETIKQAKYQTEISLHYQKRLIKYENKLFEFLNHDNVSWNNSNAENAIKILSFHTNKNMSSFSPSKIDEFLKIMSIYQSCEYKNISFLKFLLSKEKSINAYLKKTFKLKDIESP